MHRYPTQTGFTLLEMMLVVALAAVILGIGVPNFRQFMLNNRMSGAANDMMTSIHAARSQAVKLHMPTVVCLSAAPNDDLPACDGDGSQGWIAFVDDQSTAVAAATDNNGQVDAGEVVLERHGTLDPVVVLLDPANTDGYIAFGPSGFARSHAGLGVPLDAVVFCDERGNTASGGVADSSSARAVTISPVGRPQTTRSIATITALGGCP